MGSNYTLPHAKNQGQVFTPMLGLNLAEMWEEEMNRTLIYRRTTIPGSSSISIIPPPWFLTAGMKKGGDEWR